jgi:hypothetical protein
VRLNATEFDQISDPMGNHSGLAAAGSSQDKYRSLDGLHSLSLGGIERGQDIHEDSETIIASGGRKPQSALETGTVKV